MGQINSEAVATEIIETNLYFMYLWFNTGTALGHLYFITLHRNLHKVEAILDISEVIRGTHDVKHVFIELVL